MNDMHALPMTSPSTDDAPRTWRPVYTIVDRGAKKYWVRIGTAFDNRDRSINLKLDAIPTNGTLQIRDREERRWDESRAEIGSPSSSTLQRGVPVKRSSAVSGTPARSGWESACCFSASLESL